MLTNVKKNNVLNKYGMYFCCMRVKIFQLLIILLLSNLAYSQGGWLQPNMNYGIKQYRISLDSSIFLPTGCGAPSGTASLHAYNLKKAAFYFDSCGHRGYFFDPSTSIWVASGGGQTLQQTLQTGSTININDTIKLINQPYTGLANSFNLLLGKYSQFNIGDSSNASNAFSFTSNNGSSQSTSIWSNIWKLTPRVSWYMFSGANTNFFKGYDTSGASSIGIYPTPTGRQDSVATKYDVRNASFSLNTGYGLTGAGTSGSPVNVDSSTILPLSSITLNTSGNIHTSPINFTRVGGAWGGTMSLATQSAYKVFGRGSGSGTPSFVTLDSNYFNGLWYSNVRGSLSAGYGINFTNGSIIGDSTVLSTKSSKQIISGVKIFSATDTFTNGLITKGDIIAANWGGSSTNINGINISTIPSNYTNTTSGVVNNIAINTIGGDTLKSSSSVNYSNVYSLLVKPTVAGTNSTFSGSNNTLFVQGTFATSTIINGGGQINSASSGFVYTGSVSNTNSFIRASTSTFGLYNNNSSTSGYIGFSAAAASGIKIDNTGALTSTKINIATGSNASVGTATLSSGTVTVSTTAVTASSIILLTLQNCSTCGTPYISAKVASTSFTITSSNGADASIVGYQIIN